MSDRELGHEFLRAELPPFDGAGEMDAEKYLSEIRDLEIGENEARELLNALWQIMCAFVELGIKVDICEQILAQTGASATDAEIPVELSFANKKQGLDEEPEGSQ